MTLKLDDNVCCTINSISDDGNGWIVTNERYVVMPWNQSSDILQHSQNRPTGDRLIKFQNTTIQIIK